MADPGNAVVQLHALRDLGVDVALDDFGTGQSSLAYLRSMPASILKIDATFVHQMGTDGADRAIVASVVTLARETGKLAVAEGVETEAQLSALTELGCPAGQGWLWAPALPLAELVTLLLRDPGGPLATAR